MKRVLFLGSLIVVGTLIVCGVFYEYPDFFADAVTPTDPTPSHHESPHPSLDALHAPIDVDAMAARMKKNQDVYQRLCNESLAVYARRHPGAHSYDDLARMTLKLASYLCVWDDYYGEGLRRDVDNFANHLKAAGCDDPIWNSLKDIGYFQHHLTLTDKGVDDLNHCSDLLAQTEYPEAFKFDAYATCVNNMISGKTDPKIKPPLTLNNLSAYVDKAVRSYQILIKEQFPDNILFYKGDDLLEAAKDDEATLKAASTGLDHAFEEVDRQNPTAQVLDGAFYVNYAWAARGSGEANTVTADGWQLFGERLARADQILSDQFAKTPKYPAICYEMMIVVLGRQEPRDQMELWFQRGISADPNYFSLYMQKRWYLLPRWYGSDEEVWKFGLECAQSDNWSAKIPILLAECVTDAADRDPHVYARPEIWEPLEKVYRAYLAHYPDSVHYRSLFAKAAVSGEHWDVAHEQFKILGTEWDRNVFDDDEYPKMRQLVREHIKVISPTAK